MTWQNGKDRYYKTNGTKTVCVIRLSGKLTFELWENKVCLKRVVADERFKEFKDPDVFWDEAIKLLGELK